jgi:hypothetical protein
MREKNLCRDLWLGGELSIFAHVLIRQVALLETAVKR